MQPLSSGCEVGSEDENAFGTDLYGGRDENDQGYSFNSGGERL